MADCDLVFTTPYLEKTPLENVPAKPESLLDTARFVRRGTPAEPWPPLRV